MVAKGSLKALCTVTKTNSSGARATSIDSIFSTLRREMTKKPMNREPVANATNESASRGRTTPRRGWLRHGNRPGNPQSAPRCGARNRQGKPCQAPALRGRVRCRLHGGHSTGPTTFEGIARLRAAQTKHGRCSAEALAVERRRRRWFANGYRSLRALGAGTVRGMDGRSHFERLLRQEQALGSALPQFQEWQREAREEIQSRDRERLRANRSRRPSP